MFSHKFLILSSLLLVAYGQEPQTPFPNVKINTEGTIQLKNWPSLNNRTINTFVLLPSVSIKNASQELTTERDESVAGLHTEKNLLINFLPINLTKNFPNLEALNFSNCAILNISSESFIGLTKIQLIDLSYNQITKIDPKSFSNMKTLLYLSLGNNSLTSDHLMLFKDLVNLNNLTVSNNSIAKLEKKSLSSLVKLVALRIDGNKIKTLKGDEFEKNTALQYVYMKNNGITKMGASIFKNQKNLKIVDLYGNCANGTFTSEDKTSNIANMNMRISKECSSGAGKISGMISVLIVTLSVLKAVV